jgi:hypothetical protein
MGRWERWSSGAPPWLARERGREVERMVGEPEDGTQKDKVGEACGGTHVRGKEAEVAWEGLFDFSLRSDTLYVALLLRKRHC